MTILSANGLLLASSMPQAFGWAFVGFGLGLSVMHLLQRQRRDRAQSDCKACRGRLTTKIKEARQDHSIAEIASTALEEFVSEPDFDRAVDGVLRRFVPNPGEGFAALARFTDSKLRVMYGHGLSHDTTTLEIDEDLLTRVQQDGWLRLGKQEYLGSRLAAGLQPEDREKARQLYLIAVGDDRQSVGVLMTSNLFPKGCEQFQSIRLATALAKGISATMARFSEKEACNTQLRSTQAMLELRAVTDGEFHTPLQMVETFLGRLAVTLGGERASLFLTNHASGMIGRRLVCWGTVPQAGVESRWQKHDSVLAESGTVLEDVKEYRESDLARIGVETLVGSALVVPLFRNENRIGVVVISKKGPDRFPNDQFPLIRWASEHLNGILAKALNHAVIERQAKIDGLTGLANRRTFDERIGGIIDEAVFRQSGAALLMIDLDRFKSINDTYGHQAGDEVLRQTAGVVSHVLEKARVSDRMLAARYGGEELAVLLSDVETSAALKVAEAIRQTTQGLQIDFGDDELHVTASIGVATCPENGRNAEELIAAADAALYQAKETGRNKVCRVMPATV